MGATSNQAKVYRRCLMLPLCFFGWRVLWVQAAMQGAGGLVILQPVGALARFSDSQVTVCGIVNSEEKERGGGEMALLYHG